MQLLTKTYNWTKEKVLRAYNWTKTNVRKVLIALGIIGVALAAGNQTTILDTSIFNYPLTANTNLEKLEFLYQAQETLRLEHNAKGKDFLEGKISGDEWQRYLKEYFEPKSEWIGWGTSIVGEKIGDVTIDSVSSTTGKTIQTKQNARSFYKEDFKKSTHWQIDLDNILKK